MSVKGQIYALNAQTRSLVTQRRRRNTGRNTLIRKMIPENSKRKSGNSFRKRNSEERQATGAMSAIRKDTMRKIALGKRRKSNFSTSYHSMQIFQISLMWNQFIHYQKSKLHNHCLQSISPIVKPDIPPTQMTSSLKLLELTKFMPLTRLPSHPNQSQPHLFPSVSPNFPNLSLL